MEDARAHILCGAPRPMMHTGASARGTWGNRSGGDLAALDPGAPSDAGGTAASANGSAAAAGEAAPKPAAGAREEGAGAALPPPAEPLPRQATAEAAEFLTAKSAPWLPGTGARDRPSACCPVALPSVVSCSVAGMALGSGHAQHW
jgi:hypothetical protein